MKINIHKLALLVATVSAVALPTITGSWSNIKYASEAYDASVRASMENAYLRKIGETKQSYYAKAALACATERRKADLKKDNREGRGGVLSMFPRAIEDTDFSICMSLPAQNIDHPDPHSREAGERAASAYMTPLVFVIILGAAIGGGGAELFPYAMIGARSFVAWLSD